MNLDRCECCNVGLTRSHVARGYCKKCWAIRHAIIPRIKAQSEIVRRVGELRSRLIKLKESTARLKEFKKVEAQIIEAKVEQKQDLWAYQSYKEDFVGDLFNGCFGEEWLLE